MAKMSGTSNSISTNSNTSSGKVSNEYWCIVCTKSTMSGLLGDELQGSVPFLSPRIDTFSMFGKRGMAALLYTVEEENVRVRSKLHRDMALTCSLMSGSRMPRSCETKNQSFKVAAHLARPSTAAPLLPQHLSELELSSAYNLCSLLHSTPELSFFLAFCYGILTFTTGLDRLNPRRLEVLYLITTMEDRERDFRAYDARIGNSQGYRRPLKGGHNDDENKSKPRGRAHEDLGVTSFHPSPTKNAAAQPKKSVGRGKEAGSSRSGRSSQAPQDAESDDELLLTDDASLSFSPAVPIGRLSASPSSDARASKRAKKLVGGATSTGQTRSRVKKNDENTFSESETSPTKARISKRPTNQSTFRQISPSETNMNELTRPSLAPTGRRVVKPRPVFVTKALSSTSSQILTTLDSVSQEAIPADVPKAKPAASYSTKPNPIAALKDAATSLASSSTKNNPIMEMLKEKNAETSVASSSKKRNPIMEMLEEKNAETPSTRAGPTDVTARCTVRRGKGKVKEPAPFPMDLSSADTKRDANRVCLNGPRPFPMAASEFKSISRKPPSTSSSVASSSKRSSSGSDNEKGPSKKIRTS